MDSNGLKETLQRLERQSSDLNKWLQEASRTLQLLQHDHELITGTNPLRFHFAVDFHEIRGYCFPFGLDDFVEDKFPTDKLLQENEYGKLVDDHISRSTFFFGLPKSYYPHMLLYPHYLELRNLVFHRIPSHKVRPLAAIRDALKSDLPDLEKTLMTLDEALAKRCASDALSDDAKILLETLARRTPSILYLIANLIEHGAKSLQVLLDGGRFRSDITAWPVYGLCSDTLEKKAFVRSAYSFDPNPSWLRLLNEIRTAEKYEAPNVVDSMALTIVQDLNRLFNKNGTIILLVSSTTALQSVVKRAGDDGWLSFEYKSRMVRTPLIRGIDSFRYYNHYRLLSNDPNHPNNEELLENIRADIRRLKAAEQLRDKMDKLTKSLESQQQSGQALTDQISSHIDSLNLFITNADELRKDLYSLQMLSDSPVFLGPYEYSNFSSESIVESLVHNGRESYRKSVRRLIVTAIKILSDTRRYHNFMTSRILRLKIGIMSELYLSAGSSELISKLGGKELTYLETFRRFPYHIAFDSAPLIKDVEKLMKTLSDPLKDPDVSLLLKHLKKMAVSLAKGLYWKGLRPKSPMTRLDHPERLLASYTFLLALGNAELVEEGVEEIFKCNLMQRPEFAKYSQEFMLLNTYSYLEKRGYSSAACQDVLARFGVNPQNIEQGSPELTGLDPRILHLTSYIAGYGIRKGTPHPGFNQEIVTKYRRIAFSRIREELSKYTLLVDMSRSCLSYSLALSDDPKKVHEAKVISDGISTPPEKMFRGCLHARGLVLMRYAETDSTLSDNSRCRMLEAAYECLIDAKSRKRFGAPLVKGENRLPGDIELAKSKLDKCKNH
jgi:hypothetical protein